MHEQRQLVLEDARGIGHGVFRSDGAVGFDRERQLVIVQVLTDAGRVYLVRHLANRRVERIDRDQTDRRIGRTVGRGGDIALPDVGGQFHVERRAFVEMADHQVLVHDLDVARDGDVAGLDGSGAGRRQLESLGAFALHADGELLDVQDDVGDVFTHTGQRRELVQHVLDLDRGDRRALERRQENAAKRVAQRQAEATLQRFGNERRLPLAIAALLFERVGLLQFLPVLCVDRHVVPLSYGPERGRFQPWREAWPTRQPAMGSIRRGDAWKAARRCAGSRSRHGSRRSGNQPPAARAAPTHGPNPDP